MLKSTHSEAIIFAQRFKNKSQVNIPPAKGEYIKRKEMQLQNKGGV